jgi:mRNA interferase RelE/StbE
LQVGEVIWLDRDTADLDTGVLLISQDKGRNPRLVQLYPTATAILTQYAPWRGEQRKQNDQVIARTARKQLTEQRPGQVAFAAYEFIIGPLLENPHRVAKRLHPPLDDRHRARRGTHRVFYRIDDIGRPSATGGRRPTRRRLPVAPTPMKQTLRK